MGQELYEGSEISYEIINNSVQLYWDNDVVSLVKRDVIALIPILEEFINAQT